MPKKKLPKGIRENKGSYEARATINKVKIHLYGKELQQLTEEFEREKERVRRETDYRSGEITLNDWLETWFTNVKQLNPSPLSEKWSTFSNRRKRNRSL